ncbi:MAG: hypothetical protein AMXMBFR13_09700 [Phycisphaerae bacterium]
MQLQSLRDLFLDQLQDLFSAEVQLIEALPAMAEAASSDQLRQAFEVHLEETKQHAARLRQVIEKYSEEAGEQDCEGMAGLLREADELLDRDAEPEVLDAALIAAAQRVEHYEMAAYGTARTYAEVLGDRETAQLLQETLNEEKQADEKLNQIAKGSINLEAART